MSLSLTFKGVELASRVINWNQIEEIKEVLLVDAQLFVSEVSLVLDNSDQAFSPDYEFSMVAGSESYNLPVEITEDGVSVFTGLLKNISTDNVEWTATLDIENLFTSAMETTLVASGSGQNPGSVMIAFLKLAGLGDYIDEKNFLAAGAAARAAGATIGYSYAVTDGVSVLGAINDISRLASISVFVVENKFRARAYRPYQGSSSQLREPITDSTIIRAMGSRRDRDTFANEVVFQYGASSSLTLSDKEAQRRQRVTRTKEVDARTSLNLYVSDLTSATFFGGLILARSKARPLITDLRLGPEHKGIHIGHRHPVTVGPEGFSARAFEIIETHRKINEDITDVVAVSLE